MDGTAGPQDILQDVKCKKAQSLDWAFLALLGALMPFAERRAVQLEGSQIIGFLNSQLHCTTRMGMPCSGNRPPDPKYKKPRSLSGGSFVLGAWRCTTLAWHLPHYHRRSCVSLLSSEWIQVVPQRYCHQAKTV